MFNDSLKQQIQKLIYDRCLNCRSLIATDVRRDAKLLQSIYEQLPASYWEGLNKQTGFHRIVERHCAIAESWEAIFGTLDAALAIC